MQHTLPISRFGYFDAATNPALNVVIVYEDLDTGKKAKKTFDLLAQNLSGACHLTDQMWKFDVLTIHQLSQIALKDAAQADIIIISCRGDELPDHIKAWIEAALAESCNVLALVALIDDAHARSMAGFAARRYLAAVARRARIEFFAQPSLRLPERQPDQPVFSKRNAEVIQPALTPFASVIPRGARSPRWGINE